MQNVKLEVTGNELVIRVNLKEQIGTSRTGKSILLASTQGNALVPGRDDVRVGVNVYRKIIREQE